MYRLMPVKIWYLGDRGGHHSSWYLACVKKARRVGDVLTSMRRIQAKKGMEEQAKGGGGR